MATAETDSARDRVQDGAQDRALVQAFVRRHYSLAGSLRLHRRALGWDLLRAPANVVLAPWVLALRLLGLLLRRAGLASAGRWLAGARLHLRSDVGRAVEAALIGEVLLQRPGATEAVTPRQLRLIEAYVEVRSAVAEITATLLILALGFLLFRAVTPGVLSLTPYLADQTAHALAVERFPLGSGLGRFWYDLFPPRIPGWLVGAIAITLAVAAAVLSSFAGLVADPVQRLTGLHRRRLMRLLAALDDAGAESAGIAREHLLARLADLADAGGSLLRVLR